MELSANEVYDVLKAKGVTNIYHANSVITACHFLRANSLLSRGLVERRGLYQTRQTSDVQDKIFGIWFDVFADTVDIHDRAKRPNAYGPVSFEFALEVLKHPDSPKLCVTKLNPIHWGGKSDNERWFGSIDELKANFYKGRFDQMIVFRHCGGELPFRSYLNRAILDDPQCKSNIGVNYFQRAGKTLMSAKLAAGSIVKIVKRTCPANCGCVAIYQGNGDELDLFAVRPRI